VGVVDAPGIPKQGPRAAGVARQYCGALGTGATCQVGVFLGSAAARGHALAAAALWLPREWADDPDRCRRAGVPAAVIAQGYRSRTEVALALRRRARATGAVVGDGVPAAAAFGAVPDCRDALDAGAWRSVPEGPATPPVFTRPPRTRAVRLGPGAAPRPVDVPPAARPVRAAAAALPARAGRRLTGAQGAQGPRPYALAARRGWESRAGHPGRRLGLVLRRTPDGSEPKSSLSNAPPQPPLPELARVGACRWSVETEFQHGTGEVGLDEDEVRSWAGWHHHMAMVLLAGAVLLTLEQDWGGKQSRQEPHQGGWARRAHRASRAAR
jgi:hypothetical protein